MRRLLFGTKNPGKQREIRRILGGRGWEILFPEDYPPMEEPEETGADFAENAAIKARAYAALAPGLWTAAEDSGLVVPALGGEPGVFSARYGGRPSDTERNTLLLERMAELHGPARAAYYVAVIVLREPAGSEVACEGRVDGFITHVPKGESGFGYDPIFVDPASGRTFAQLPPAAKDALSHRGRALKNMVEVMRGWVSR
jgi:XTP/dITP diphosphohydrolase